MMKSFLVRGYFVIEINSIPCFKPHSGISFKKSVENPDFAFRPIHLAGAVARWERGGAAAALQPTTVQPYIDEIETQPFTRHEAVGTTHAVTDSKQWGRAGAAHRPRGPRNSRGKEARS